MSRTTGPRAAARVLCAILVVALVRVAAGTDCSNAQVRVTGTAQGTLSDGEASETLAVPEGHTKVLRLNGVSGRGGAVSVTLKGTSGACELHARPNEIPDVATADSNYPSLTSVGPSTETGRGYVVDGTTDGGTWFFALVGKSGGCTDGVVKVTSVFTQEIWSGSVWSLSVAQDHYNVYYANGDTGYNAMLLLKLKGTSGACSVVASATTLRPHSDSFSVTSTSTSTYSTQWGFAVNATSEYEHWWFVLTSTVAGGCTDAQFEISQPSTVYPSYDTWQYPADVADGDYLFYSYVEEDDWNAVMMLDYAGNDCEFWASTKILDYSTATPLTELYAQPNWDTGYIVADGGTDTDASHDFFVVVSGANGNVCSGSWLRFEGLGTESIYAGAWYDTPPSPPASAPGVSWPAKFVGGVTDLGATVSVYFSGTSSDCELYLSYEKIDLSTAFVVQGSSSYTEAHFVNEGGKSEGADWWLTVASKAGSTDGCVDAKVWMEEKYVEIISADSTVDVQSAYSWPSGGMYPSEYILFRVTAEAGRGGVARVTFAEDAGGNGGHNECDVYASADVISADASKYLGTINVGPVDVAADGLTDNVDWWIAIQSSPAGSGCGGGFLTVEFINTEDESATTVPSLAAGEMWLQSFEGAGAAMKVDFSGSAGCAGQVGAHSISASNSANALTLGDRTYYLAEGTATTTAVVWWVLVWGDGATCPDGQLTIVTEDFATGSQGDGTLTLSPVSSSIGRYVVAIMDAAGYPTLEVDFVTNSTDCVLHVHVDTPLLAASSPLATLTNGTGAVVTAHGTAASAAFLADGTGEWALTMELCPGGVCGVCGPGTYSANSLDFCALCDAGTYAPTGGMTSCTAAPVGHHVAGAGATAATACAAGAYQDSTGQSECKACETGKYNGDTGQQQCTDCPSGSAASSTGSTNCTVCAVGTFAADAGANSCSQCVRGTYLAETGGIKCNDCELGQYAEDAGSTACTACPLASTTLKAGATSKALCECAEGSYGDPLNGVACAACPANAACARGTRYPSANAGYWLSTASPNDVMACSPSTSCPGGQDSCSTGYTGDSCSVCDENYYRSAGQCHKCTTSQLPLWLVITGAVLMLTVTPFLICCLFMCSGYLYAVWMVNDSAASASAAGSSVQGQFNLGMVKSAFVSLIANIKSLARTGTVLSKGVKFAQLSSVVIGMQISWPASIEKMFSFISVANFNFDAAVQPECQAGDTLMNYESKFVVRLLVPVFLVFVYTLVTSTILVVLGLYRCLKLGRTKVWVRQAQSSWSFAIRGLLMAFNVLYVFVHSTAMELFTCFTRNGSRYYLVAQPDVECFVSGTWTNLLPFALVGVAVYSFGIPALFGSILFSKRHRLEEPGAVQQRYGFLWDPFERQYFYWEVVVLTQKFFLVGVMPFAALGTQDQINYLLLVTLAYMLILTRKLPYEKDRDDTLEFNIIFAVFYTVLASLVFVAGDMKTSTRRFFEVTVIMVHSWVWIALAYVLFHDLGLTALCSCYQRICCCGRSNKKAKVHPGVLLDGHISLSAHELATISRPMQEAMDQIQRTKVLVSTANDRKHSSFRKRMIYKKAKDREHAEATADTVRSLIRELSYETDNLRRCIVPGGNENSDDIESNLDEVLGSRDSVDSTTALKLGNDSDRIIPDIPPVVGHKGILRNDAGPDIFSDEEGTPILRGRRGEGRNFGDGKKDKGSPGSKIVRRASQELRRLAALGSAGNLNPAIPQSPEAVTVARGQLHHISPIAKAARQMQQSTETQWSLDDLETARSRRLSSEGDDPSAAKGPPAGGLKALRRMSVGERDPRTGLVIPPPPPRRLPVSPLQEAHEETRVTRFSSGGSDGPVPSLPPGERIQTLPTQRVARISVSPPDARATKPTKPPPPSLHLSLQD